MDTPPDTKPPVEPPPIDPVDHKPEPKPEDKVSYESHQRLLGEKKKLKEKADQLEADLLAARKEKSDAETKRLEENENFKELYEKSKTELAERDTKLSSINSQIEDSQKMRAFLKAAKSDIKEQYWNLVDLSKIQMENGVIDEFSVQKYVESFTASYAEVMKPIDGRKLPSDNADPNDDGAFTLEKWGGMNAKDKEANLHLLKGKI